MRVVVHTPVKTAPKADGISNGNRLAETDVLPALPKAKIGGTGPLLRALALSLVVGSLVLVGIRSDAQAQSSVAASLDHQVYLPLVAKAGIPAPVPSGLVAWWDGDDDAGDISGNGYNGTMQGGAGFAAGKVGDAFNLNGVNQYVLIPDSTAGRNPNPLDPTAAATLDAWVLFHQLPSEAGHYMTIVAKSGEARDLDLQAENYDNRFHFYVDGSQSVVSSTVIERERWYFVAGTYEANHELRMYVNGALERTTSIPYVTRVANGEPVTIGASHLWPGRFLNGLVDEVELFGRALTSAELLAIYNAGGAGKCKPGACS